MAKIFDKIEPDAMHYILTKTLTPVYDTCKQGKFCKGICDSLAKCRPYRKPYDEHCYCRNCHVWMQLAALLIINNRQVCACCKRRPKMKSYRRRK